MNDSPILIDLDSLTPHPANPRIVEREDVIATIEQQLKASGFDPSHAILVRPLDGSYQIISGHNRTTAARRAGLTQVPAWVREMDDDTAFMQLVLSNAQGELAPLERGMHALRATEKGKWGKSIKAYAERVGRPEKTLYTEVQAAEVAKVCPQGQISNLIHRTKHLAEIHAAPEACWQALVKRLLEAKCVGGGCHGESEWARLITHCAGPGESYLWRLHRHRFAPHIC